MNKGIKDIEGVDIREERAKEGRGSAFKIFIDSGDIGDRFRD